MSDQVTHVERRTFLGAVSLGAPGALALLGQVESSEGGQAPRAPGETTTIALVDAFCASMGSRDAAVMSSFFAEDGVYRMTETTPSITGLAAIRARFSMWVDTWPSIEFAILDRYAKGPMVINHRIDRFTGPTRPFTWEGIGVFFVKDGKIKEWQDYTIRTERPPA